MRPKPKYNPTGPGEDGSRPTASAPGPPAVLPLLHTGELPSTYIARYMEGINKRVSKINDT